MPTQKIAVVGATGLLGRPVAEELIAAGFEVTILARSLEKARQLFPTARVLPADVFDRASLEHGLEDQDAVYASLNLYPHEKPGDPHAETDGLRNLVAAAQANGLGRIAFLSSLVKNYQGMNGFDWWVLDVKQQAVEIVKSSGLPYTLFYPSSFMEVLAYQLRQGNRLFLIGTSKQPMYFIAAHDYGKQVARSFQVLNGEDREYAVQGPAAYRMDEAAQIFVRAYQGADLRLTRIPMRLAKVMGLFSAQARYGAHISEALNEYPESFEAQPTWEELGTPATTLTSFARHLN